MSQELQAKLRAARAHLGESQAQLAKRLNIPKRTLQDWEQDRRTPRGFALEALIAKLDSILKGR